MADITARFVADFEDFNAGVNQAERELGEFEGQTSKTGSAIGTLSGTARQFDSTLAALGVNIKPATAAVAEIEAVAGKSASALGLLGTAGATLSAAVAGWQIGRQIAAALGTDELIGNAVAKWMGWGDVVKETAGAAADAVRYASEREIIDTKKLAAELAAQSKQRAQQLEDEKKEWDAATKIRDRFFGDDAINKATDYTKALGMLGGYIDTLSREQLVELRDALYQGVEALARSGRLTDEQAISFGSLAGQADLALAALEPLAVVIGEDLVKAQWDYALANDAMIAGLKATKDEAEKTQEAIKKTIAEGAGVAIGIVTDAGGVAHDIFGKPVIGPPGLGKTFGQAPVTVNINSPLGTPDQIARAVGNAVTQSYSQGGNRMPV